MQPTDDLRVLVVAEDHLARAGLAALVADQPGCTIVAQVPASEYASVAPQVYGADVAVWDLGWDTATALEHLTEAQEAGPPTVVLVPDEAAAVEAWTAGPRGLLPRDVDGPGLRSALVAVARGLAVFAPDLSPTISPSPGGEKLEPPSSELTPRELDVIHLMAEGVSNKTIAYRLNISDHTVKFHVNSILAKLGAGSRTEAVIRATRMGVITL